MLKLNYTHTHTRNLQETAYVHQAECRRRIRIRTPDYFQNLTGTFLSKDTSVIKFSSKSDHSVRRYEPNCVKMRYLAMLMNPSKNSWIRIRKRMTPKIKSVLSCAQTRLCENFREDPFSSFYVKLLIDKHTDRQTKGIT